jgi:hypothetical protein
VVVSRNIIFQTAVLFFGVTPAFGEESVQSQRHSAKHLLSSQICDDHKYLLAQTSFTFLKSDYWSPNVIAELNAVPL